MTGRCSCQSDSGDIPRREFLGSLGHGIAGIAIAAMLERDGSAADHERWRPPDGTPHFTPRAKNVIWLFMRGGLSHVESFDPKPALNKYAGKTISETRWKYVQDADRLKKLRVVAVQQDTQRNRLFALQTRFKPYGESAIEKTRELRPDVVILDVNHARL